MLSIMLNGHNPTLLIAIIKVTAYVLLSFAQYRMIRRVIKGQMKSVVLAWFGWSLLMGISVVAQLQAEHWVWDWNLFSVILSATGCAVIGIAGLWSGNYSREKGDVLALIAGIACMGIYFLFTDPWITTSLAIIADLLVAIPMLQGAWKVPSDHRSESWPIVFCAWSLTSVGILFQFSWLHLLWPLYLIGFSGFMTYLTFFRSRPKIEQA